MTFLAEREPPAGAGILPCPPSRLLRRCVCVRGNGSRQAASAPHHAPALAAPLHRCADSLYDLSEDATDLLHWRREGEAWEPPAAGGEGGAEGPAVVSLQAIAGRISQAERCAGCWGALRAVCCACLAPSRAAGAATPAPACPLACAPLRALQPEGAQRG